jgi:hypothetical protein
MKLDNIEFLKEEIIRKDLQLIRNIYKREVLVVEQRIKKWKSYSDWDNFIRMAKEDICKDDESVDFAPINIMCTFIENGGDPLLYLKTISMSYPEHPFSHMLVECENVSQFLNKLRPLEENVQIIFLDDGKKWLSELFEFYMDMSCHFPDRRILLEDIVAL